MVKKELMELTDFLHAGTVSHKLKGDQKFFGVGRDKNRCGQSSDGNLKLIVSEKWTDGINWFFACYTWSQKLKADQNFFWVGIVKNGFGQSGHRTHFFHAGTNSGKLKVDLIIFGWVWWKMTMAF